MVSTLFDDYKQILVMYFRSNSIFALRERHRPQFSRVRVIMTAADVRAIHPLPSVMIGCPSNRIPSPVTIYDRFVFLSDRLRVLSDG